MAEGGTPPVLTVLQDFIWLPENFVAKTLGFYKPAGASYDSKGAQAWPLGALPASLLGYPRRLVRAPAAVVLTSALGYNGSSGSAAGPEAAAGELSVFTEWLRTDPVRLGWPPAPPTWDSPLANIAPGEPGPHFFWECFCCTAPWSVLAALNGVDERLDESGDDCHERNLSERARLLGLDVQLQPGLVVTDIDHRAFSFGGDGAVLGHGAPTAGEEVAAVDLKWNRSKGHTNIEWWGRTLSAMLSLNEPIRPAAQAADLADFSLPSPGRPAAAAAAAAARVVAGPEEGGLVGVALVCPVTSVVKDCLTCEPHPEPNPANLLLLTTLLASLCRSAAVRPADDKALGPFRYGLYLAYDPGDEVYDVPAKLAMVKAAAAAVVKADCPAFLSEPGRLVLEFLRVGRSERETTFGNITPLWNRAAQAAVAAGHEYIWLVNDDMEIETAGAAAELVRLLRAAPTARDLGAAAPKTWEAEENKNATHGTVPMIHRSHLEV